MSVIRIPPTLRAETGGEKQVVADGETVRDLVSDLVSRFPGLRVQLLEEGELAPFVNVYVEGEDVRTLHGLDTQVDEGATVILLPAMAGGSFARTGQQFPRGGIVPSPRSGGDSSLSRTP